MIKFIKDLIRCRKELENDELYAQSLASLQDSYGLMPSAYYSLHSINDIIKGIRGGKV